MTTYPALHRLGAFSALSVVLLSGAARGMMETFDSQGVPLKIEVFEPTTAGSHPAVVIAYGTDGMTNGVGDLITGSGDAIRDFADELAKAGYVALIPDYFERTRTKPGIKVLDVAKDEKTRNTWVQVVTDAMVHADKRAGGMSKGRVGLLGFSLGGHLVLRAGMEAGSVKAKAVVEFAGPTSIYDLRGNFAKMPILQVHHGDKDGIVRPDQTQALRTLLVGASKTEDVDYFIIWYTGEGHVPFKDPMNTAKAQKATIDFFEKNL